MTEPTHTNYAQAWMEAHAEKVLGRKEPETVAEGYQREAIKHMRDEGRFADLKPGQTDTMPGGYFPMVDGPLHTEALAKSLAIKLAVRELGRIARTYKSAEARDMFTKQVISNLLIGLGCEAVVDAWNEVG